MEYFELVQDRRVENPISLANLDKALYKRPMDEGQFSALAKIRAAYYKGAGWEETCDLLTEPVFMVSSLMKHLLESYENNIGFKAVQAYPENEGDGSPLLYWVPCFQAVGCLHTSSKGHPGGQAGELVVAGGDIPGCHIFRIAGLPELKVLVSLPLAESLLQNRLYGVGLQKVRTV